MGNEPLAVRFAGTAAATSIADMPGDVVAITKQLVLDQLGLQLRGATLPNVAPVARLVVAAGGTPESTVVGTGTRTSAPYAASFSAVKITTAHARSEAPRSLRFSTVSSRAPNLPASSPMPTCALLPVSVSAASASCSRTSSAWGEPSRGRFRGEPQDGVWRGLT